MKGTRRVDMVMGIGYDDDIDKAKQIMADILAEDERILKDPAPQIAMIELADSSVNFVVRPWANASDYWGVYMGITEKIKKAFDANGISIPYPQRDVHLYQHSADDK
jgi:small conductance mechanosensitive channel